ncbi:MAG: type II secretion system minor pseudopilin GspJ [Parvularculaceae bacterium]
MTVRAREAGLTLTELLVALLIFSMISSAGVYALRSAVDGRAQLDEVDDRVRAWQLARTIIRTDFSQVAARVVRDETGARQAGPFVAGVAFQNRRPVVGETPLVGFVRRGWANPDSRSPRSTLQYVEYLRVGDALVRRVRPYLDDAPDQPRTDRLLFRDAENLELTFLAGETTRGLDWVDLWPAPTAGGRIPRAVRLAFDSSRFGRVEQLFWIGEVAAGGVEAEE